jgi:hypothetical protein
MEASKRKRARGQCAPRCLIRRSEHCCSFNGVIADDETPHLLAFHQALAENGLQLTDENYYGRYLGDG